MDRGQLVDKDPDPRDLVTLHLHFLRERELRLAHLSKCDCTDIPGRETTTIFFMRKSAFWVQSPQSSVRLEGLDSGLKKSTQNLEKNPPLYPWEGWSKKQTVPPPV